MTILYIGMAFTNVLQIPYLEYLGFNEATQGWIFALGAVFAIIGQMVFGYLCDRFRTNKWIFFLSSLLFAIVNWLFYSTHNNPLSLIVLWCCLTNSLFCVISGIFDSWIIETDKYCLENYGLIRAFGAIGWAIGAWLTAYAFAKWDYVSLGNIYLVFTIVLLIFGYFIPETEKVVTKEKLVFGDIKELLVDRRFVIITLIFLFTFIISNSDNYTPIFKMIALGASKEEISLKYSFQAVCELPLFFLGGWCIKKFGAPKVLSFALVMYIIRFILSGMAVTPTQIIYVSILQAVTYPLVHVCTKIMIDEVSLPHLRSSSQQLSASIYGGGSMLIAPIICGMLVNNFSYNIALFTISAGCIIPLIMLVYYNGQRKTKG